ncbi:DUF4747 family protein [Burkholderia glumae]|uniref:DUF4747 family protein n=1 Tax=Burkholderia glumae TaxID=337 RepID=A0ABY5BK87_BURGL|nr:DUF4747 family protein [Burkholderia glumae]MCR1770869.1 DUF4747 family protein [Burkholderia glumae]USS46439.1 DUF4747 family protein [Burkholderia glumae]UVS94639.1 DUF4747 family protein [Burkholderia glumae]
MANYFRTLHLGALNVVLQPHSAKIYVSRFQKCTALTRKDFSEGNFFGRANDGFLITSIHPINERDLAEGFQGEVARFLKFDPSEASQWLKLSDGKQAEQKDIINVRVPSNLKPNLGIFRFAFYPKSHRLVFEVKSESRSMSHRSMLAVFDHFFNHPNLPAGEPRARVNIEQSYQMVSRILKLENLAYINVRFARPNDLLTAEDEEEAIEGMSEAGIEEIDISLQRTHEKPIQLWDWLKRLAGWTASNGSLTATGYENGKKLTLSTKSQPITKKPKYDSRLTVAGEAFKIEAEEFGAELDKRRPS